MFKNECRGKQKVNAPMSETNVFNYDNRFDLGFCSRANTRFAPTFVLGRNYLLGYCKIPKLIDLCGQVQDEQNLFFLK